MDIRRVFFMFMDLKRSTEYLREHQQEYMFDEEGESAAAGKSSKMDVEK